MPQPRVLVVVRRHLGLLWAALYQQHEKSRP